MAEIDADDAPGGGRKLMTLAHAADKLHVSVRTIRRMIAYGYLPGYRVGPRVLRVHEDDVNAALRRLPDGYADDDGDGDD